MIKKLEGAQVLYETGVLKIFTKFPEKDLCGRRFM